MRATRFRALKEPSTDGADRAHRSFQRASQTPGLPSRSTSQTSRCRARSRPPCRTDGIAHEISTTDNVRPGAPTSPHEPSRITTRLAGGRSGLWTMLKNGAPERIRTSDPQIRSLVLYPAELRARSKPRTCDGKARWSRFSMPVRLCERRERCHGTGRAERSGILSSKAAPVAVSSNFRLPPCSWASSADMGSPSPVPPRRVEP